MAVVASSDVTGTVGVAGRLAERLKVSRATPNRRWRTGRQFRVPMKILHMEHVLINRVLDLVCQDQRFFG